MTVETRPRATTDRTLDAHVRALAVRASQRQRVGATTAAAAAMATLGALGSDYGDMPLTVSARRRATAYFTAVLRAKALRDRRPEDGEFLLLLKVGALVSYLRQAAYTESELRLEIASTFGRDGVAAADRAGLLRERNAAA
jgi:hypothetical protein